ncbi:release factor glutamine methyltransferase [Pseudorhizobium tarimense]|uniref:Release factor glutamine methyltransferase n=1 Tax=Pseudorhizobium tarimense TaxID=1079109 RepID=A0ABV2H936_9HYPH|nr:peptide chain release factor N(5)-glutamine methyltransferase [Pseudorhizobium tarimense]MCJ8520315.1 peptide chain release factor N(5)-glutamine methyltransferase [Pseudorhizobium tarimense]
MTRLGAAVADARARFAAAGLADAPMEARVLIGGLLGLSSMEVFAGEDLVLTDEQMGTIEDAVVRRLKREPVHRILGEREFHGMVLKLSKETLEPRPDTETLVDRVLPRLRQIVAAQGAARVLDLGTGTGAIILALLKECAGAIGFATDISDGALETARANAVRLGLSDRLETVRSNWFEAISGRFDIIVSNPPYIQSSVVAELEPEVRDFDPPRALDGGADGLDAYRAIAAGALKRLASGGVLGVEIGYDQKDSVTDVFAQAGFQVVEAACDYGGNDRVLLFSKAAGA